MSYFAKTLSIQNFIRIISYGLLFLCQWENLYKGDLLNTLVHLNTKFYNETKAS